jgi:hypothetical protein
MYGYVTASAVDGGDHPLRPDGFGKYSRELEIDRAATEQSGTNNHRVGAAVEYCPRALNTPDPAADAAGKPPADHGDQGCVVSQALGGVKVDELYARKTGEPCDPWLRISGLHRERLALNELDDVTVLQIDRRNQHLTSTSHAPRLRSGRLER